MSSPNPDTAAMQAFAATHGNNLHVRVASLLRANLWDVLISPYYRDNATDKAREADIIAEREFPITTPYGGINRGTLRFRLVIECKYIAEDTLCWFDGIDRQRADNLLFGNT